MRLASVFFHQFAAPLLLACLGSFGVGLSTIALIALISHSVTATSPLDALPDFFLLCGVVLGASVLSQRLLTRLTQDHALALTLSTSRRILLAPLSKLESIGAPRLLALLTSDVVNISRGFAELPAVLAAAASLAGACAYLGWLSWEILATTVGVGLVGALAHQALSRRAGERMHEARQLQDLLYEQFRGLIDGNKELKLDGRQRDAFLQALNHSTQEYRVTRITEDRLWGFAQAWGELHFFIAVGLLLALGGLGVVPRELLPGAAMIILYILSPVTVLTSTVPTLARADHSFERIEALGQSLEEALEHAGPGAATRTEATSRIELRGATHRYPRTEAGREFILGPIDLTLRRGELIFLIGGNGSGKSTLARLLTGLYVPHSGEILLDGQPVTPSNLQLYREHFAGVFADCYLFEHAASIADPSLDARAREHLESLGMASRLSITQGRLSRTRGLSQGERKRVALISAFLQDRPFYLFDEWAADQDPAFKAVFYNRVLPELKARGKGIVVISHDDRYFHVADRLVKLEDGHLIEGGGTP